MSESTPTPRHDRILFQMEGSATEAYRHLLSQFGEGPEPRLEILSRILTSHERSLRDLEQICDREEAGPAPPVAVWADVREWIGRHERHFEDLSVINLLWKGELEGDRLYREAIRANDLDSEVVEYFSDVLLPRIRDNAAALIDLKVFGTSVKKGMEPA